MPTFLRRTIIVSAIAAIAVGGSVLWSGAAKSTSVARVAEPTKQPPVNQAVLITKRPPWQTMDDWSEWNVQLCQALGPAAPCTIPGVDCADGCCCDNAKWRDRRPIGFQEYAQGEYVGRARLEHVPEYRLRVDDEIEFIYRITRDEMNHPYQINVGDEVRVESFTDANLDRSLIVQPDGTITLRLLGEVKAAKHTVTELREKIDELYKKFYKTPAITVTPIKVNTKLEDLRATIDARAGNGGQRSRAIVTPEGTVGLPAVGSVPAQGLSLRELKQELDERYAAEVDGIEVTPVLFKRAPRYVYVMGEVRNPGRYSLDAPTTVMQAITMAGSWFYGGDVRRVVVLRRADDWHLQATVLDLRAALLGRQPCPAGEIWISDSDIVIVPKSKILLCNHYIELYFTKGLYGVVPFTTNASVTWTNIAGVLAP
jgi:polysaccharide export outer membrane protein